MSNLINETFQKHLNLLKKHLNEKKSKLLLEINFTVPEAIEVLKSYGVSNAGNLSSDELKKVYRKLASKYHPDSGGSHKDFININSAYETLKKSSSSSSQVPPQSNQQRQQPSNQQSTSDDLDKEKFRSQYEKQQQEFIAQYEKRQQEFRSQYEKQQQEFIAQYEKRQQEFIAQYEKQQQQQQQELERQKRMRKYQKV